MNHVHRIAALILPALLFACLQTANAQVPAASGPQKEGCAGGVPCGGTYQATSNGVTYDCICNCNGEDNCTPRSSPSSSDSRPSKGGSNRRSRHDGFIAPSTDDNSAQEAEQQRIKKQQELDQLNREANDRVQQEEFEKSKNDLESSLRGGAPSSAADLKTDAPPVQLKSADVSEPFTLKPAEAPAPAQAPAPVAQPAALPPTDSLSQENRLILDNLTDNIKARTINPNDQASDILYSLRTKAPPSPLTLIKKLENLQAGDVILVSKISADEAIKLGWGHYTEAAKSQAINLLDRWGSHNSTSTAFHAMIFLGEHYGKRWYLDNTLSGGPKIIDEDDFTKEYGKLQMDVASYVAQPIGPHQGAEIWKAAHELQRDIRYGIWANDKMVCSETSRWVLVRAGLRVPEKQSANATVGGVDTHLNKKDFVNFTPSDFYDNEQYFVINTLGMPDAK